MSEQNNIQQPQLDVNDIYMALTIIKTAMSRGVFKPEEYLQVGLAHDKLNNYIEAIKANAEATNNEQPTESKEQ